MAKKEYVPVVVKPYDPADKDFNGFVHITVRCFCCRKVYARVWVALEDLAKMLKFRKPLCTPCSEHIREVVEQKDKECSKRLQELIEKAEKEAEGLVDSILYH